MGLPITSKPIRTIFFECLRLPNAQNNYFSSEQIAEICNHAGNLANGVSKELVARALSNDSMSEYCLGFADLFEQTYVMSRDLTLMENGRYKSHPAFALFMRGLNNVPVDDDVTRAGSAYFEKFLSVFFETFGICLTSISFPTGVTRSILST